MFSQCRLNTCKQGSASLCSQEQEAISIRISPVCQDSVHFLPYTDAQGNDNLCNFNLIGALGRLAVSPIWIGMMHVWQLLYIIHGRPPWAYCQVDLASV